MRYRENNIPAGVASRKPGYRTCVLGFPFETIEDTAGRELLMGKVLEFLSGK